MLSDNYRIYIGEIISLVDSFVLKSEIEAEKINKELMNNGIYVDLDNQATWKYYLNLNGQYHANDRMVQLVSSDTEVEIILDKTVLDTHPVTAIEYGPNGIYYNDLIKSYPSMRTFIDGVFNPVEIPTAISAPDFTILWFNDKYIASNETDLIDRVQDFIFRNESRWNNRDYNDSDSLYAASYMDLLYKSLVAQVVNLRTEFCNTSQVSQFHLWSKLKGLYGLDAYKDSLTTQQALWLYRNTRHLILHAGTGYLLEDMIEKLAHTANLDAFKYDYVKVEENLVNSIRADGLFMKRRYEDDIMDIDNAEGTLSEESTLYETLEDAPKNEPDFTHDANQLKALTVNTTVNQFPTGLLKLEPKSNSVTDRFNDQQFKLDYWVYLCGLGLFQGNYQFNFSGRSTMNLSANEALILYIYANTKACGVKLTEVPVPRVLHVAKLIPNSVSQLKQFVDNTLVSRTDLIETLTDHVPPTMVSTYKEFDNLISKLTTRRIRHDFQWQAKTVSLARSQLKDVIYGSMFSGQVEIAPPGTTYLEWLGGIELSDIDISDFEWYEISLNILKTLLNIDPKNSSLPESQKAIIEIIDKLSGYAVNVTAGESTLGSTEIDWPFLIAGDAEISDTNLSYGFLSGLNVVSDPYNPIADNECTDLPLSTLALIDTEEFVISGEGNFGMTFESDEIDQDIIYASLASFQIQVI